MKISHEHFEAIKFLWSSKALREYDLLGCVFDVLLKTKQLFLLYLKPISFTQKPCSSLFSTSNQYANPQ